MFFIRELKHRNISSRLRFILREWTGSRTAFLVQIFNLSSASITTTDARRVKGAKPNSEESSRKQTLNCKIGSTYGKNLKQKSMLR